MRRRKPIMQLYNSSLMELGNGEDRVINTRPSIVFPSPRRMRARITAFR
jgi:hypothetical protein